MNKKLISFLLDFVQVSAIFTLLITGPVIPDTVYIALMQSIALTLMLSAAWVMRRTRYYRVPDVGRQNELVTEGVYRYIRNPMYLSELLFTGSLVLHKYTPFRILIFLILFADLILKIYYEEKLLLTYFRQLFVRYQKTSWRLIPFIY